MRQPRTHQDFEWGGVPSRSDNGEGHAPTPQDADPQSRQSQAAARSRKQALVEANAASGLKLLLDVEAQARKADDRTDLNFIIANESRKLTSARQIFVFKRQNTLIVTAISGLPKVERNAPLVQDIEHLMHASIDCASGEASLMEVSGYPFPKLLWQPFMSRDGNMIGGMLLAREVEWNEGDVTVAQRLGETYSHAMEGLETGPTLTKALGRSKWFGAGKRKKLITAAAGACLLAMLFPVQMSVLAPMEVVAKNPYVISAPIEGAIEEILVDPSDLVEAGQPIVRLSDTVQRNKLDVAKQEVEVAQARLKKASQMAFNSEEGRQELRMAMADLELKRSQFSFASELYERTVIRAQRAGLAVFSDKQGLTGKPVVVGERIMRIANPEQLEVRIDVPVSDALVLKSGAEVRLFLDSDPVHARPAIIRASDYQAQVTTGDVLAFRAIADFAADDDNQKPRLGVRGTAQIYGDTTLLGFYLFRRPFAALRQYIGI